VVALRRGDPAAAENLVAAYGDRAYRLATRITRNAQDAEEAMQDAFLSVIRKIDTFRGDATFGSWVYRIVANAAYQCCRRRRRRSADVSLDTLLPVFDQRGRHVAPVVDWSMSVDDPTRQTELRLALGTAIEELGDDYRAVVVLRDVEGLPNREIAEILGLTVVNVKMRVHRARLFLRKRLEAHLSIAGPRWRDFSIGDMPHDQSVRDRLASFERRVHRARDDSRRTRPSLARCLGGGTSTPWPHRGLSEDEGSPGFQPPPRALISRMLAVIWRFTACARANWLARSVRSASMTMR